MKLLWVVIAFGLLLVFQLPRLQAKEKRRDLWAYMIFMSIAFVICLLSVMGVKFPYVSTELMNFFRFLQGHIVS